MITLIAKIFNKNKSKIIVAVIIAFLTGLVGFLWKRADTYVTKYEQAQSIIFKKDSTYKVNEMCICK